MQRERRCELGNLVATDRRLTARSSKAVYASSNDCFVRGTICCASFRTRSYFRPTYQQHGRYGKEDMTSVSEQVVWRFYPRHSLCLRHLLHSLSVPLGLWPALPLLSYTCVLPWPVCVFISCRLQKRSFTSSLDATWLASDGWEMKSNG